MSEEKVFAKGFCFAKIFIFFIIGCVIGTYYEEILHFISYGDYSSRQGVLIGPFSPIYGAGIAIFVILLGKHNNERAIWKTLIYTALIGGITEYVTSLIAEVCFGVQFWDYSGYFLNIHGRTTIPFMIFWGLGGTILTKVIYPFVSKYIEKIPYRIARPIYICFVVFISIDLIVSYAAFGRMALRDNGTKPYTFIGEWLDDTFDDDYMYDKFPVMRPHDNP